jgi:ATP synthase I chain
MPILAVGAVPLVLWRWRWPVAAGFAIGCVLSIYSFWALSRSVQALAERITQHGSRESGGRIVALLLFRYGVMGAVAYGIFKGSVAAVYGLLGGLALPVAAIFCEAAFELYVAVRRGL